MKKSYAEITNSEVGIQNDLVIRTYNTHPKKANDSQVTLNKVKSLIRDGLKFTAVYVVKCEHKTSQGNKPGVIFATLETREQKLKVLENKKKLRNTRLFVKVYIEASRPLAGRRNETNMMTVLQEMGKTDQYILSNNGRIVKRGFNGNQGNQRNEAGTQR